MRLTSVQYHITTGYMRMQAKNLGYEETGEALIRVHACSVGYVDALLAVGGYQVKPPEAGGQA